MITINASSDEYLIYYQRWLDYMFIISDALITKKTSVVDFPWIVLFGNGNNSFMFYFYIFQVKILTSPGA